MLGLTLPAQARAEPETFDERLGTTRSPKPSTTEPFSAEGGEPAKRLPPGASEAGSVTSAKELLGAAAPILPILVFLSSWKTALGATS